MESSSKIGKSVRNDNSSPVVMSNLPKKLSKKRTIFRSLKKLFSGSRSATSFSTSKQSSSCTWTETGDTFGSIDLVEDQNKDEGYEDYEDYSFLDFWDDEHIEDETKQKILTSEKSLILEIKSLIAKARRSYHRRSYQDALDQQLHILDLIHSALSNNEFIDVQLRMQEAMVECEILKIKYVLLKECFTIDERRLAHDKTQNSKLNLVNKSVIYYQDELLRLSNGRNVDVSNLDKVGYTLYLLHTLAKIHNKKLARYSHALDYYNKALELEIEVLAFLEARYEGGNEDRMREIQIWNMNIRATREKIGMIHYITGRFSLAMKRTSAS